MDDTPLLPEIPTGSKRPQVLTVLCILTFIWSGMNTFSYLFIAGFFDAFMVVAREIMEKFDLPETEMLLNATPGFFLVTGLLNIGSVVGAVFMWRRRKAGFHVYTISQILMLISPMYFLRLPSPSILELLLSGIFILLYSTQLKQMR